jgi:hypothetical protein
LALSWLIKLHCLFAFLAPQIKACFCEKMQP